MSTFSVACQNFLLEFNLVASSYRYWSLNPDQDATETLQERAVVVAKEVIGKATAEGSNSGDDPAISIATRASSSVTV